MTEQFTCQSCGFQTESEDHEELVEEAQEHGQDAHDKDVPREKVEQMIEEA